jgi:hypothetical protein
VASEEDIRFLNDQENMVTVQMAHGDFLEDIAWNDSPSEKDYDIVFNGTFDEMPRKRHQLMLHLLHHPLLRRKNILFLGRGQNREVEAFKKLVDQEGLGARVTVAANLRRSDIPEKLRCCRIGVHLSLYENACRSIYEFFRSNLPCVASSCMGGMNSQVFNSKTGVAVADGELAEAIALVLSHRDDFEPRRWFLENSGSLNSTKRLNQALRSLFEQLGYDWSSDIVRLGSSGANRYVARSDYERFMPDFEWLLNCLNSFHHQALTFSIE